MNSAHNCRASASSPATTACTTSRSTANSFSPWTKRCDSLRRPSSWRRSGSKSEPRPPERKPAGLVRIGLPISVYPSIDGRLWRVNLSRPGPRSLFYVRRHIPDCGHRQCESKAPGRRPRGIRPLGVPAGGPSGRDVRLAPGGPRRATATPPRTPPGADPFLAGRARLERGSVTPLGYREDDFAELLSPAEIFVGRPSLFQREHSVDDGLESSHEHEFHDLVELPPARHGGPEDGELPPEKIPRVELEHRPRRRPRDDHPASLSQRAHGVFEGRLAHVVDDHIDPAAPGQFPHRL